MPEELCLVPFILKMNCQKEKNPGTLHWKARGTSRWMVTADYGDTWCPLSTQFSAVDFPPRSMIHFWEYSCQVF